MHREMSYLEYCLQQDKKSEEMTICPTSRKHMHTSRGKAVAHLKSLQQRFEYEGHVYFCPDCQGWHVGREKKNAHKNKYA